MLSLIIAEAALETVPHAIAKHPSVIRHADRREKKAQEILLDRSYHHAAMLKLNNASKRGRPDLVHFSLLEATSTPLYRKGLLEVCVHTATDKTIFLHSNVRLPKSYFRFEGVMEELFEAGKIRSNDTVLMKIQNMTFHDLLDFVNPSKVIGLSRTGIKSSAEQVANIAEDGNAVVVGGFPSGHFSSKIQNALDRIYSISEYGLEAHLVLARILYEYEKKVFGK